MLPCHVLCPHVSREQACVVPDVGHQLTLDKHKLCTKQRAQRKRCPCRQTTTRWVCVCVVLYVFTQMATRGIWYQLHLLPRSLFASDLAWLESVCFSCPGFDWTIRYLCVALIGGCCWNLRRPPDQEEMVPNSIIGNLSSKSIHTEGSFFRLVVLLLICIFFKVSLLSTLAALVVLKLNLLSSFPQWFLTATPSLPVSTLVRAAFVCVRERLSCHDCLHMQSNKQHNTSSSLLFFPLWLWLWLPLSSAELCPVTVAWLPQDVPLFTHGGRKDTSEEQELLDLNLTPFPVTASKDSYL